MQPPAKTAQSLRAEYSFGDAALESGGALLVFGKRLSDSSSVLLKIPKNDHPSSDEIEGIEREYRILRKLDAPGVPRVLALEPHAHAKVLVLEGVDGVPLAEFIQREAPPLERRLAVALSLTAVVEQVHRAGVTHKSITFNSILVHPKSLQTSLLHFGFASETPKELQPLGSHSQLADVLPYMAPEQTGRMNRTCDLRSDLYSLGAVFYELFTGAPPFAFPTPMELLHAHIALPPAAPHAVDSSTPEPLGRVILKLLAKNAEERYQSAQGLRRDLERLQVQLRESGGMVVFALGEHDAPQVLQIPEKLYGRDAEIKQLMRAFHDTTNMQLRIMMVSGEPGIGKTFLINEMQRPVVEKKGYFISGKYDQYKKNIPYTAIIQALRRLTDQLLTEPEEQLAEWKRSIEQALGGNGGVITEAIPDVALIIGAQPEVEELPPMESKNRRETVFQDFIKVFARPERPLVLFIDDLQWADRASLKLLNALLLDPLLHSFFFIGAYRHTEVHPGHPFLLFLDQLANEGLERRDIRLSPLSVESIDLILQDSLSEAQKPTLPLAELVHSKTLGNPFFAHRFILKLHEDQLISFSNGWTWDLGNIMAADISDNVVSLMAETLKTLTEEAWAAIKLASCMGVRFSLHTLARVMGKPISVLTSELTEAVNEGVLIKAGVHGVFAHDRVQEAAYSLISEEERREIHAVLGRTFRDFYAEQGYDETCFTVAVQLNNALPLLTEEEKEFLVGLNHLAGRKAKESTAYQSSVFYYRTAASLLPDDAWEAQYDLALSLYTEMSEAMYLATMYDEAEEVFDLVVEKARSFLDKVIIYQIMLGSYHITYQVEKSLSLGAGVVHEILPEFPKDISGLERLTRAEVDAMLKRYRRNVGKKGASGIMDIPDMTDPYYIEALGLMYGILVPIWIMIDNPNAMPYFTLSMANLCLEHGLHGRASIAFGFLGVIFCETFNLIDEGVELGGVGLQIHDKYQFNQGRAFLVMIYYTMIHFRKGSFKECASEVLRAYHSGLEYGNNMFAAYAINHHCLLRFYNGDHLDDILKDYETFAIPQDRLRQPDARTFFDPPRQLADNLRGGAEDPRRLTGRYFDEVEQTGFLLDNKYYSGLAFLRYNKLWLACFFGEFEEALSIIKEQESIRQINYGQFQGLEYSFLVGVTWMRNHPRATPEDQTEFMEKALQVKTQMAQWSVPGPETFQARYLLLCAEIEAVRSSPIVAMRLYDQAIQSAVKYDIIHIQALANELAGSFYLEHGLPRQAETYCSEARYCYDRWGAEAKVRHIEERYSALLSPSSSPLPAPSPAEKRQPVSPKSFCDDYDLLAILRASQIISDEVLLPDLTGKLMRTILENAGAQKATLLLKENDELTVQAEAFVGTQASPEYTVRMLDSLPLEETILPASLIQYTARTGQTQVLDNASEAPLFAADPYISRHQVRSALCLPIVQQDALSGMIYLENNLLVGAFTPQHQAALELLAGQAAISIKNAMLYSSLTREISERKRAEDELLRLRNLLSNIVDSMPSAIIALDAEKQVLLWNKGAEANTGVPAKQAYGRPLSDVYARLLEDIGDLSEAIRTRQVRHAARKAFQSDGEVCFEDITVYPLAGEGVEGAVIRLDDVTERVRMEHTMVQSEKMMSVGGLAAGMAHEINNPLGGILGFAQVIQTRLFGNMKKYVRIAEECGIQRDKIFEYLTRLEIPIMLQHIQESGDRAAGIVRNMLAFSRKSEGTLTATQIPELLDETLKLAENDYDLKKHYDFRQIKTRRNYTSHVPPVMCEANSLQQVLFNLLKNGAEAMADKHYGEGGPQFHISVFPAQEDAHWLVIEIEDNGPGMDEVTRKRVFEPFYTTKQVGKGTGLGLSVSYFIITNQHRGVMTVESEPGEWTRFTIKLPVTGGG